MSKQKSDNIVKYVRLQKGLTFILVIGLAYFYGRNVDSLHTVWELGDEAGYLWNAAYFAGADWKSFAAVYSYYGYGYSIILLPLFWITNSGMQLVQGAYIINILCVIGMFFIIRKLLMEIDNKMNSLYIPIISFFTCIMPYIASNTLKVFCEVFLTFWYCMLILLLFYFLKKPKMINAIFLGICGSFIFFIHTRAIIAIGTLFLTIFFSAYKKRGEYIKSLVIFLAFFLTTFSLLYLLKLNIIDYKNIYKGLEGITSKDVNIIDSDYILERLKWFNPKNYLACFMTKILYATYATGSIILPGIISMVKQLCDAHKSHKGVDSVQSDYALSIVKLYIMITFILMVIASTMGGTGNNIFYAVYGRYYEYTLPILFSFSFFSFINEKIREIEVFICIVLVVCIGIWGQSWCMSYLADHTVGVDTNRIAAFAKAVSINNNLEDVFWFILLYTFALMILCLIFNGKKYGKLIVIFMISITLLDNTYICINTIHEIHDAQRGDTEIAEYLLENVNIQKIYFIDDSSYRYPFFYSRMQVLLKDMPIVVINPNEEKIIEDGSYVLAYSSTELKDSVLSNYIFIAAGKAFNLYQK